MAKVAIIGAGSQGRPPRSISATRWARTTRSPSSTGSRLSYVPSWVWVGIGRMPVEKTRFPLEPVYGRFGVRFVHGRATEVRVDERAVVVERDGGAGTTIVDYDTSSSPPGPDSTSKAPRAWGPRAAQPVHLHRVSCRAGARPLSRGGRAHGEGRAPPLRHRHRAPRGHVPGRGVEYITNVHKDLVRRGCATRPTSVALERTGARRFRRPRRERAPEGPYARARSSSARLQGVRYRLPSAHRRAGPQ